MAPFYSLLKKSKNTQGRLGEIHTAHGKIQTPVFMPVGTVGTVKAMRPEELSAMGAEIILGNTYHLYLRPGHELIARQGGLHQFMNWKGPMLTDSGGFQVFSLGREGTSRQVPKDEANPALRETKLAKTTDEGVEFQSHIDGSKHWFTPEKSIEIQEALGADIMMCFDECTAYPATEEQAQKSMERSLTWEEKSLAAQTRADLSLFAIVQGGMYPHLRQQCQERLWEISERSLQRGHFPYKGYALGGLSVGEPSELMYEMTASCTAFMREDSPRYLMGVGLPQDIVECVDQGIDMFDCVIPTRNARNGMLFTQTGYIYITQAAYAEDSRPIDENCTCYTCQNYSRAYLRHLHLSKEILSSMLSTIHNLHYYLDLLRDIRLALQEDKYPEFKKDFLTRQQQSSKD